MQEGEVSPCAPKQSLSATPSAGSNAARNACLGKKSSFDVLASPDTKEELIDKNSGGGVELRTFF